ncbi:riboflavin kinase/FMN adenylyltransferase [Methylomarinovum tepidoasis]|uniref:Riboflavin biosynthesis protein n=1 Tax=Methylomarinovum tepidoasis TaxID=2840183 RepID=A0AAU9CT12_9GAMM|nr:bifunctional riboflavin kinase/FAD synthetase [Methylomarinovum sp. IN45]BCX87745.1 riboflavin kinase/FMN adenylyltransferase [Methylomarinovum sp. IN45]
MRLIRGLHNLPAPGTVATIGNFDGVHLGHRYVIHRLAAVGARMGLPVTVVLFEPQPQEYFRGAAAPARLTRLREKVARLAELPVDRVLVLRFDRRLAPLPAAAFIDRVLVQGLGVKYLVVGDDFRFGRGREGDFALLRRVGETRGFEVVQAPSFTLEGVRVSSTRVREALERGDMETAAEFLGRPYSMCGRVAAGRQRGRDLGFPTANIDPFRRKSPVSGVFAVTVTGVAERPWPGVANVGVRPTVAGTRVWLEVHLFDFHGDLYGRQLEVFFRHKLREERRFPSLEALRAQIQQDAAQARQWLEDKEPTWTTNTL